MDYTLNLLKWPINKRSRSFRAYVVQPERYDPTSHPAIFNACMRSLLLPDSPDLPDQFDLVTFPEAFLTPDVLCSAMRTVASVGGAGCVHVGLRATADRGHHLFQISAVVALLEEIKTIPELELSDLEAFEGWLATQAPRDYVNLACLFTCDADRKLRVCLHPKLLRSKFERSPFRESNMVEASLHSLVTLIPRDTTFIPVTIHPLICSDGLRQQNDRRDPRPLEILTTHANRFETQIPDHIDLVSLCTCTPQQCTKLGGEVALVQWHEEFRKSFVWAASDDLCARHQNATFLMSNFALMPDEKTGGLSGAFVPVPIQHLTHPPFVETSSYEKPADGRDTFWTKPSEEGGARRMAYIAAIDPRESAPGVEATMLGFTIPRMLRDSPRWTPAADLTTFDLYRVEVDTESGNLTLKVRK
jgi:hypothetical protein